MRGPLLTLALGAFLGAGCATEPSGSWNKSGASTQDFEMDKGRCQAQAFSVTGTPPMQVALVFNSCMRGKGWQLVQDRPPPSVTQNCRMVDGQVACQ